MADTLRGDPEIPFSQGEIALAVATGPSATDRPYDTPRTRWIRGPVTDTLIAWCWVPFALVAWSMLGDMARVSALFAATLLFSFAHQPLTNLFLYGDRHNPGRIAHMHLFVPVVALGVIVAGMAVSPVLVAVIAGVWNAEHTLMQRFGLARRYGRADGMARLEKHMLLSWLALAAVWAAADTRTAGWLPQLSLGSRNRTAIQTLLDLGAVARFALLPAVAVVITLTWRWWSAERALGPELVNPAKRAYIAATAALIAVMVVHPLVGIIAYVGSHSLEYFAFVTHTLSDKYGRGVTATDNAGEPLARTVGTVGALPLVAAYTAGLFGVLFVLESNGWYLAATYMILTLGAMHLFFDAFVWRRRTRRATAIA